MRNLQLKPCGGITSSIVGCQAGLHLEVLCPDMLATSRCLQTPAPHEEYQELQCSLEVLILFAALSTCDPGNILETIKAAKQQRVRVSIVGLAAEVHICRRITEVCTVVVDASLSTRLSSLTFL